MGETRKEKLNLAASGDLTFALSINKKQQNTARESCARSGNSQRAIENY